MYRPCVKCGNNTYLDAVISGNSFMTICHEYQEYVCFKCFVNNYMNRMDDGSAEEQETLKSILMLKMKNIKIDHIMHIIRMLEEDPILYDLLKGRFGLDE